MSPAGQDDPRVELSICGAVAHLRLVRTAAGNAIDPAWVASLDGAVTACTAAPGVRAVLISAAGTSFSVGGDLRHFRSTLHRLPEELGEMISGYHATLDRLAALPVPVVCAVQGAAAGGALGLLWCADVVLAADDAKLATGYAALGLSGDGGSSWFLPRLVGLRRARELILENRTLSAAEALEWGLVSRVVPPDRLDAEAKEVAARLAAGPTVAYAEMRRLLARSLGVGLGDQLDAERSAIVRCGATADAVEGIAAFTERRPPRFAGR